MTLRYGLGLNHLTEAPNDYTAVVTDSTNINVTKIMERMIGKGSTVTKAEGLSVIEEFEYAVVEEVKNGNIVSTDLFRISPSISGVFEDENDSFDPSRHSINLNISPGPRLQEIISKIELKKVALSSAEPVIEKFVDLKTKVENESFTPGQIASIKGSLLKFNEEDNNQGVFFIAVDGTETRVTEFVKNKPSELMFFVPDGLTIGNFQLEVRNTPHKLKTIKKGRLSVELVPAN
ncbi:DNA-binding domain-containing protein [Marinifilum fragile]|uniref:DNA-binding domain-containing protein n=1 Tax=Marinifilum fragile TaxID=570161 RepID=UPI002AA8358A|nr:DNA-binding domain-containing protein [Marinifilum fragile]